MTVVTSIKPKRKWFKTIVAKVVMVILGRAFKVFSEQDLTVKREVAQWPEGFKLELNVVPFGPRLILQKRSGRLFTKSPDNKAADLSISFKNIESAFLLLTPQIGVPQAFAERRLILIGDVAKAMSFTRCLNIILAYLYPDFLCKNLMRRIPPINSGQRISTRIYFYTIGLIIGT